MKSPDCDAEATPGGIVFGATGLGGSAAIYAATGEAQATPPRKTRRPHRAQAIVAGSPRPERGSVAKSASHRARSRQRSSLLSVVRGRTPQARLGMPISSYCYRSEGCRSPASPYAGGEDGFALCPLCCRRRKTAPHNEPDRDRANAKQRVDCPTGRREFKSMPQNDV